jgi:hypothetical protein
MVMNSKGPSELYFWSILMYSRAEALGVKEFMMKRPNSLDLYNAAPLV